MEGTVRYLAAHARPNHIRYLQKSEQESDRSIMCDLPIFTYTSVFYHDDANSEANVTLCTYFI